jgi:hypothetical protein
MLLHAATFHSAFEIRRDRFAETLPFSHHRQEPGIRKLDFAGRFAEGIFGWPDPTKRPDGKV